MTSPFSRISPGSFFTGLIFEYSSFGWPGTTVAGGNSILSIRPGSIAAMRPFRAKGGAGGGVSVLLYFFFLDFLLFAGGRAPPAHPRLTCLADCLDVDARHEAGHDELPGRSVAAASRRDDFLPLLAESLDAGRDPVADVEVFRRLHASADAGRRACRDDVAGQ